MYFFIVAAFMFVLPLACSAAEVLAGSALTTSLVFCKWFVFWAVGVRLGLAGLRQILQPRYTAEVILSLKNSESLVLVRELGFANLSFGLAGVASLVIPAWRPAMALTGGVFYALAGVNHVFQPHRGALENVAMASDLWAGLVLLGSLAFSASQSL